MRPTRMPAMRRVVVLLATGCGLTAVAARGGTPLPQPFEFEGEYGLSVGVTPEGLDVRWLTDDLREGTLTAYVDGEVVARSRTEAAQAHRASVETAAPVVTLEYGAVGGDVYTTTIERGPPAPAALDVTGVDSVYVFGDVHGQFERVARLLHNAGLIDPDFRWTGGDRHVVFLGDLFDRGDDVTRVLWFIYGLERQARAAGGGVHVVLGNHELMVMSGDLRYVSGKESMIAYRHSMAYADLFDPHDTVLGRWLASKPGLMRVDDLLLAHGGMSPAYVTYDRGEFEDSLTAFLGEDLFLLWNDPTHLAEWGETTELDSAAVVRRYDFFFGPESVFWYRDWVRSDTLGAFLDRVLERYDAHVHIIGHTPSETIQERYDGRLIATDLLDAASEMLFLARREDGGWERYMVPLFGEPVQLGQPTTMSDGSPPTALGPARRPLAGR